MPHTFMPRRKLSHEEYAAAFFEGRDYCGKSLRANALERALDIRKFEIDLYWKRATYFWTFIAATLAGFVALQASALNSRTQLSVLLCSVGTVFSFAWLCVNRGSKYWQENWESHVDMLEDSVHGPLYKVVLARPMPNTTRAWFEYVLAGSSPLSVSKINQIISLFVTFTWCGLLWHALPPFSLECPIDWYCAGITFLSALTCISFVTIGKTNSDGYLHSASIRSSSIK